MLNDETLEERLHRDLDRVRPGAVPLDALIGRGRAIRTRRRAGFAAGLAAMAAMAVGTTVALSGASSRVSAAGHTKELASGTIGGKRWSFVLSHQGPGDCSDVVTGTWGETGGSACLEALPVTTDPVNLSSSSSEGAVSLFTARLRPDVDHVTVTETDGAALTPAVTEISGHRFAFFALPAKQGVTRIDAVGTDGKTIAYAMPYNGPDNRPAGLIELWYPAGTTPTQNAVRGILLSDTQFSSTPVTVTVDVGPFGVCYLLSAPQGMGNGNNGPDCHALTPPAPNDLTVRSYPFGENVLLVAEVNKAVNHVDVMPSDGHTTRLTPVSIGGHSFVATLLPPGISFDGARAYDASGTQLAKTP